MKEPVELPQSFAPPVGDGVDVLVVAGEHSGDQHAARMVAAARQREPGLRVAALGGPELEKAGAQLLLDMTSFSVVGLAEVVRNYGFFKRLFALTIEWVRKYKPRAVCFVDYPGFNLRVAKALATEGLAAKAGGPVRLLYYISPQIWAWKAKRRFTMARVLDELAVIFPFERDTYADTDLRVTFVGHPFVTSAEPLPVRRVEEGPVLLLPGSRPAAVGRIFPAMLAAFAKWRQENAGARACVVYPSDSIRAVLEDVRARFKLAESVELRRVDPASPADGVAVLTSSGTMSLACALSGLPGSIVYRAHPLTYAFGRMVVTIPYLGIANLLLERPFYPEYIQNAATPERLAGELRDCLRNPERRAAALAGAEELRRLLAGEDDDKALPDAGAWLVQNC